MPDLDRYRQKREQTRTPEPFGDRDGTALPAGARRRFTVQQHAATRMHWDLRLEIDGVLVSWAVPRGPTLNPKEKRLAVQTEDHPLEYAFFEGNIPPGNYGAGAMILWDTGAYHTVDGVSPLDGLTAGKLDFILRGYKLHGRFALIRTGKPAPNSWLLLRKGTAPADDAEVVEVLTQSIYSGLSVVELGHNVSRSPAIAETLAAAPSPSPSSRRGDSPMLAVTGDEPFDHPKWLFELKYDGYRLTAHKPSDGSVHVHSRNGTDYTAAVPEIVHALRHLAVDQATIDGELVALDPAGRPDFEALGRRLSDRHHRGRADLDTPLSLMAFDVLEVDGIDLRGHPIELRKQVLREFVGDRGPLRYVDHVVQHGRALFTVAEEAGLEGVMGKRLGSVYRSGRSDDWVKIKGAYEVDVAIVGYTHGKGAHQRLGALACAVFEDNAFRYVGHVGSGLRPESLAPLAKRLDDERVGAPTCNAAPKDRTQWSQPRLVARVRCSGRTRAGRLRHPVFVALREDKLPQQCGWPDRLASPPTARPFRSPADPHRAALGTPEPEASTPRPSGTVARDHQRNPAPDAREPPAAGPHTARLNKVFWPESGHTKGDLIGYYESVWPWLSRYLADRPLVVERFPDGVSGKCFFQRRAPDFLPDWIPRRRAGDVDHVVCNDLDTMRYIVGLAAIVLHIESARFSSPDHPDWVVLDLDPKQAPFPQVVHVARHVHRLLSALDTPHAIKTSGRSGLHILVPLDGGLDHHQARSLAEILARTVHAEIPDLTTLTRPIAARGDRVYLDYLQNGAGKLIVAPFSARAQPTPTVSAPLRPGQLTRRLSPTQWTIATAPRRINRGGDAMATLFDTAADVPRLLDALSVRLRRATRNSR
ncbi:MAG: DNA ligase D [Myxococcales bacterium FL481]|nr:MAG: DNA ligase D [Myxococcales bacterium FL481]